MVEPVHFLILQKSRPPDNETDDQQDEQRDDRVDADYKIAKHESGNLIKW